VRNFEVQLPDLSEPKPFIPGTHTNKYIKFIPVKDEDKLILYYHMPYCQKEHQTKPLNYISFLVGHEGENSLLSYLKHEGLAQSVESSVDHWIGCLSLFVVEIKLTKKGLGKADRVVETCSQYFQKIKAAGPKQSLFDEMKLIGESNFKFMERTNEMSTVVSMTRQM